MGNRGECSGGAVWVEWRDVVVHGMPLVTEWWRTHASVGPAGSLWHLMRLCTVALQPTVQCGMGGRLVMTLVCRTGRAWGAFGQSGFGWAVSECRQCMGGLNLNWSPHSSPRSSANVACILWSSGRRSSGRQAPATQRLRGSKNVNIRE